MLRTGALVKWLWKETHVPKVVGSNPDMDGHFLHLFVKLQNIEWLLPLQNELFDNISNLPKCIIGSFSLCNFIELQNYYAAYMVATLQDQPTYRHSIHNVLCQSKNDTKLGSGCDSVGKAVASDTRGPQFESSHWQKFIYIEHLFTVNYVLKRRK